MEARARELEAAGLARRQGSGFRFERNLIETLRAREIDAATDALARRTGLTHRPSTAGDYVSGVSRERGTLAYGRFALELGRAACRERVCQYVLLSVVAVTFNNKNNVIVHLDLYHD